MPGTFQLLEGRPLIADGKFAVDPACCCLFDNCDETCLELTFEGVIYEGFGAWIHHGDLVSQLSEYGVRIPYDISGGEECNCTWTKTFHPCAENDWQYQTATYTVGTYYDEVAEKWVLRLTVLESARCNISYQKTSTTIFEVTLDAVVLGELSEGDDPRCFFRYVSELPLTFIEQTYGDSSGCSYVAVRFPDYSFATVTINVLPVNVCNICLPFSVYCEPPGIDFLLVELRDFIVDYGFGPIDLSGLYVFPPSNIGDLIYNCRNFTYREDWGGGYTFTMLFLLKRKDTGEVYWDIDFYRAYLNQITHLHATAEFFQCGAPEWVEIPLDTGPMGASVHMLSVSICDVETTKAEALLLGKSDLAAVATHDFTLAAVPLLGKSDLAAVATHDFTLAAAPLLGKSDLAVEASNSATTATTALLGKSDLGAAASDTEPE